jgi:U3 small nucleolar RNA-associated protein 21
VSDNDVFDVSLPSMQGLAEDEGQYLSSVFSIRFYPIFSDLDALSALTVSDAPIDVFSTPPQLDGELITLTLLPRSRWQTLLNLEVIQAWDFPLPLFLLTV